jgi:hypothetical protein
MKIVKTNLKFKTSGNAPFVYETPAEHIKNHTVMVLCGPRGCGKDHSATNIIEMLKYDVVISITPSGSFESNHAQYKRLNIQPEHVFDPDDPQVVQKITNIIDSLRDDLLEYRQKLKMLKELKANIKNPFDLHENYHLFSEFIGLDGNWVTPEHKYGGRYPKVCVLASDVQSTLLFRNRQWLNLCIKSRHVSPMPLDEPSLGVSLIMCVQSYTSQGGSLPRAIRQNMTHFGLWRLRNQDTLDLISKELSGEVSPEKFLEVYQYIMADEEDKHVMMFVDLFRKPEHPSMFRRNYTEFVVM